MLIMHDAYRPLLEKNDIESLEHANARIAFLKKQTMVRMPMARNPAVENPQHFIKIYTAFFQAQLRRLLRLFSGLCLFWDNQQALNATFITKAIYESAAQLCYLNGIIEKCIADRNYDTAYTTITHHGLFGKTGFGEALIAEKGFKNINIMEAIRYANKTYPIFNQEYNWLSEFTHPNCLGMAVTFSRINYPESRIDFLEKEEINVEYLTFFISAAFAIDVFYEEWKKHQLLLKAIKKIDWKGSHGLVRKMYPKEIRELQMAKILRKKKGGKNA